MALALVGLKASPEDRREQVDEHLVGHVRQASRLLAHALAEDRDKGGREDVHRWFCGERDRRHDAHDGTFRAPTSGSCFDSGSAPRWARSLDAIASSSASANGLYKSAAFLPSACTRAGM